MPKKFEKKKFVFNSRPLIAEWSTLPEKFLISEIQNANPRHPRPPLTKPPFPIFGNGPNTVSESTVSNTELSEFCWGSLSSGERTQ